MNQGALARPGHAGHDRQDAGGNVHGHVPQVVPPRALHAQPPGRGAHLLLQRQRATQVPSGQGGGLQQRRDRPLERHLAPTHARPGSDVHHVIGGQDHVRIVLHDQHRVALVAQRAQQPGQARHVPRVQAHAGLVQDVQHVGQAVAQVPHEFQALALAAGQAGRLAAQAQVPQPDLHEVRQPLREVPRHARRRRVAQTPQERQQFGGLQIREFRDVPPLDPRLQRRCVQARPTAHRAGAARHELLEHRAAPVGHGRRVLLQVHPLETVHQSLVRHVDLAQRHLQVPPVQQQVQVVLAVVLHGPVQVEQAAQRVGLPQPLAGSEIRVLDRPAVQRQAPVQQAIKVKLRGAPDALALRAHALRRVERVRERRTR